MAVTLKGVIAVDFRIAFDTHRLRVIIFPHKYSETTKVAWDYYVINVDSLERYHYVADVDPNAFEAAMEAGLKSALTIGKADGFEKFE